MKVDQIKLSNFARIVVRKIYLLAPVGKGAFGNLDIKFVLDFSVCVALGS